MTDTGSNSKEMTVEQLLVQDLKENRLGALIGDEDALAKIAKRAIDEALFNDRTVKTGSGYNERTEREPSPVMKAAQECADRAITRVMDIIIDELLKNPETFNEIQKAIGALFPSLVLRYLDQKAMQLHGTIQLDALNKLATLFTSVNDPKMLQAVQQAYNQTSSIGTSKTIS